MLAEVPIKPAWKESNPLLKGFKGDKLEIPIDGTLSRPKLNAKILEQLAPQLLENATHGLLEGELHKALDRLLPAGER